MAWRGDAGADVENCRFHSLCTWIYTGFMLCSTHRATRDGNCWPHVQSQLDGASTLMNKTPPRGLLGIDTTNFSKSEIFLY